MWCVRSGGGRRISVLSRSSINRIVSCRSRLSTKSSTSVKPNVREQRSNKSLQVLLDKEISVKKFAEKLRVRPAVVLNVLKEVGESPAHPKNELPLDVMELVALELGHKVVFPQFNDVRRSVLDNNDPNVVSRPPVVTIMGHVDHGKTTLLDTLRRSSVVAQEAGGITQHIGAFEVQLSDGRHVTFLDTPGHAAFSSMRARGAKITDIIVLVVAADDGLQPQTVESIKLAQKSQVPIVIAVNKCDKPGVDPAKVHHGLLHHGVQLERFGGDVQCVEISALKGSNIPALVDAVLVQADLMNLRGNPCCPVEGVVIEAHKDKGLGAVATILIQNGTMKRGKYLVAGKTWAKVKVMLNEHKARKNSFSLSQPVVTVGWKEVPEVGEEVLEVDDEQRAKEVVSHRILMTRKRRRKVKVKVDPDNEKTVIPVIIKGDVSGSVEVLSDVIARSQPKEMQLKIVNTGLGPVTASDIETAAGIDAKILGFNVELPKMWKSLAQRLRVDVLTNQVIYRLLGELKDNLEGMLPPDEEEEVVGEAVVLDTFKLTGHRKASVAGCRVKRGTLERNCRFRIVRNKEPLFEGRLDAMKCGRDDISTARRETECGLSFHGNPNYEKDDVIQCYRKKKVPRKLTWDLGF